jgi:hypothetical protein
MRYSRLSVMVISDKPRNGVVEKVLYPFHRTGPVTVPANESTGAEHLPCHTAISEMFHGCAQCELWGSEEGFIETPRASRSSRRQP